ncbi:DUF1266 domain-containing protein [Sinomicrobium pectinilyticum]|uniref:DUF1266 domain-containing protein n=1 Tax=Sinomicrobium pectinilyticum TaxID=1084421 RepID=A0A3N0DQY1_SINP1|nr:DUF1266 domain-containing protein [Sinomicrobium pectinilyticum]RNL78032.1 DUF1266 domain-containing protein [Sinomicrobium pectinilyticum]
MKNKRFIQNNPGEWDFPPKPRWENALPGNNYSPRDTAIALVVFFVGVPAALVYFTAHTIWGDFRAFLAAGTVLVVFGFTFMRVSRFLLLRQAREQGKYYRQAGISWLPEEKRAALQLDAPMMFEYGFWPESLEHWPVEVRFSKPPVFKSLPLEAATPFLQQLDEDWGILLSERAYDKWVASLMDGVHSGQFAFHLAFPAESEEGEGNLLVKRLAELTELPENYVSACGTSVNGMPPKLIWGFDLWRVFPMSRQAFMAGLISEDKAWDNMLKASTLAHAIFDSLEDFFDNYRLGHAYWSGQYAQTRLRKERWDNYEANCRWPIKSVAWKKTSVGALPDDVRNGFAGQIAQEKKYREGTVIKGFRSKEE